MKKISVITVCLNDASGLEKTIRSLSGQSYNDFELIIIDGGSTDGSVEIIKKNLSIVNTWISEKDNGIFNAQNKGINLATGEYCLFLNSGDYLSDENVLSKFIAKNRKEDIIYGDMYIDNGDGKLIYGKMPSHIGWKQLLKDTLWHPVSFIRRDIFEKYGVYDEQFRIVADYEFFVRSILKEKVSTSYLAFPVSVFNTSGVSSEKSSRQKLRIEREKVQDLYFNPILLFLFRLYIKLRN